MQHRAAPCKEEEGEEITQGEKEGDDEIAGMCQTLHLCWQGKNTHCSQSEVGRNWRWVICIAVECVKRTFRKAFINLGSELAQEHSEFSTFVLKALGRGKKVKNSLFSSHWASLTINLFYRVLLSNLYLNLTQPSTFQVRKRKGKWIYDDVRTTNIRSLSFSGAPCSLRRSEPEVRGSGTGSAILGWGFSWAQKNLGHLGTSSPAWELGSK